MTRLAPHGIPPAPHVTRPAWALWVLLLAGSAAATPPRLSDAPPPAATVFPYTGTPEERDGWRRLLWLDFGIPSNRAPGAIGVHPELPVPGTSWTRGMVRTARDAAVKDPYLGDYAVGADACFRVAADPGDSLLVVLTVGLADSTDGTVEVRYGETPVAAGLRPGPGEFLDVSVPLRVQSGDVRFRVSADGCGLFAVPGIAVYQPAAEPRHPCLRGVSRSSGAALPDPPVPQDIAGWTLSSAPAEAVAPILAASCDHLVAERLSEGCFAASGSWYENSFPVRALLAGAQVLHRPELAEAAYGCTDRFVAEQEKDGSWSSATFGRPGCGNPGYLAPEHTSANLADVGSMVLAVVVAARSAEGLRSRRYAEAVRRYMDAVVLPQQLGSGAFPNRLFLGKDYTHPYSVATAVQASSLAGLYALTGADRYRAAAERAAVFLAGNVEPTGQFRFYPHDAAEPALIPATDLGNTYYVLESLIAAHACARRDARARIEKALRRAFEGDEGLFAAMARPDWWRTPEPWGASKKAGILFLVDQYGRRVGTDPARVWRDRALAVLGSPAAPFGVREDPGGPLGRYAAVATGFAALGAASVLDPDAVVLHR